MAVIWVVTHVIRWVLLANATSKNSHPTLGSCFCYIGNTQCWIPSRYLLKQSWAKKLTSLQILFQLLRLDPINIKCYYLNDIDLQSYMPKKMCTRVYLECFQIHKGSPIPLTILFNEKSILCETQHHVCCMGEGWNHFN